MITIDKLSVSYRAGEYVLDSLSLDLPARAIHGIVGLNGAGKTTLFDTLFGLKRAQQGTVSYNGHPLTKKDTAYLPVENFFYPNITGAEYLSLFYAPGFDREAWNALFGLPLNRLIDEYSTGMKKKLALLGIIEQDKPVLILDEPFNGLDMEMCRVVHLILLQLKAAGKTLIVSSHILESLTGLCDYIHYLQNGRIKCSQPKERFPLFAQELFGGIEENNRRLINQLIPTERENQ